MVHRTLRMMRRSSGEKAVPLSRVAGREISYRLASNARSCTAGTPSSARHAVSFTEAGPQIVRDIQAGYPYVAVAADGAQHVVSVGAYRRLAADGLALEDHPFPQPDQHPLPGTWLAWWQLATNDPYWYRKQRQAL
jgi:hypothetical protein